VDDELELLGSYQHIMTLVR